MLGLEQRSFVVEAAGPVPEVFTINPKVLLEKDKAPAVSFVVNGNNFSTVNEENEVIIDGLATTLVSSTSNQLNVLIPFPLAGEYSVIVKVKGQAAAQRPPLVIIRMYGG
ncbi:MAG: IPT/TIG domain-containing protein [Chryseolinea sp.]